MKISVSIPDDLWAAVHTATSSGPSDTVQRALRALAEKQREAARPLANAPDQSDLERYRPAFERAVETATANHRLMLDNGYRFGLLIAPGMTGSDFDALDAVPAIQEIVHNWGEVDTDSLDVFSVEFAVSVEFLLEGWEKGEFEEELNSVLGEPGGDPTPGVEWHHGDGDTRLPVVSHTWAEGALRALRDVRDEARRRLAEANHEGGDQ